jgi:hypothetical protein
MTDRENDREVDWPHRHLGEGWLTGSLAERRDARQQQAPYLTRAVALGLRLDTVLTLRPLHSPPEQF